jgi:hypothetical protein
VLILVLFILQFIKKSDPRDSDRDEDTGRWGCAGSKADGAGYMSAAWQLSHVNSKLKNPWHPFKTSEPPSTGSKQ